MAVALHHLALEAAERRPDGEAVRCDGEGLSWAELARRSHGVAHALRESGVRRGDRVAVLLAKSLDVPVAFGLSSGHTARPNITLPLGVAARLSCGPSESHFEVLEVPVA